MENFGIIVKTETFEAGDVICHLNNWKAGMPYFSKATKQEVEDYSGKNGIYLKLIENK